MSNSKWVKLLEYLIQNIKDIDIIHVKLIWDESLRELLLSENSLYNYDYHDTAFKGLLTRKPKGLTSYSEIEWTNIQ